MAKASQIEESQIEEEAQYEFNDAQEEIFLELSEKISIVSTFLIMIGLFRCSIGILVIFAPNIGIGVDSIIDGAFYFLIGFLGKKVAIDFQKIANTQGNDIDYLMDALEELRKGATFAFWLLILSAIVWVAVVIHGIVKVATPKDVDDCLKVNTHNYSKVVKVVNTDFAHLT